jgi:hypothetical protein
MASTTVKKPSDKKAKKSSSGLPMTRCGWCDRYGEMTADVEYYEMGYGRTTKTISKTYYCNRNCVNAHGRQEVAIDLEQGNELTREGIRKLQDNYKEVLTVGKDNADAMRLGETYFAEIKFLKAVLDFEEGLLRREKTDVLTAKRYKCLKLAGDLYESIQGLDLSSSKHDLILNHITHYNDTFDENGELIDGGAIANIRMFGT